jgi:hypothetical protein
LTSSFDANAGDHNSSIDSFTYIPLHENQLLDQRYAQFDGSAPSEAVNDLFHADYKYIHDEHPNTAFGKLIAMASRHYPTVDRAVIFGCATKFVESMERNKGSSVIFSTDI